MFSWWSEDKKVPFPGSIYITVKAIPLNQSKVQCKPSLLSLLPFQEEQGLNQLSNLSSPKRLSSSCKEGRNELTNSQDAKEHQEVHQRESVAKWLLDSTGTANSGQWRRKSPKVACKVPTLSWKEFSAGK